MYSLWQRSSGTSRFFGIYTFLPTKPTISIHLFKNNFLTNEVSFKIAIYIVEVKVIFKVVKNETSFWSISVIWFTFSKLQCFFDSVIARTKPVPRVRWGSPFQRVATDENFTWKFFFILAEQIENVVIFEWCFEGCKIQAKWFTNWSRSCACGLEYRGIVPNLGVNQICSVVWKKIIKTSS